MHELHGLCNSLPAPTLDRNAKLHLLLNASSAASATNATQLNGQPPSFYQNAANLSGSLPSASLAGAYASTLNLSNPSNLITGSFSGSGANLTAIPYAALTGAPTPVLLQATSPGSNQTGNLRISGTGIFNTGLTIGSPHTDLPLIVAGHARISDDGVDGDALRIGGPSSRAALTSEAGENILNLDMNFHVANATSGSVGAAVRVDGFGNGVAPIQLLTRAAGSTVETTALMVLDTGQVGIGIYPLPGNQFSVQSSGTAGAFSGSGADCVTVINSGAGRGLHANTNSDTALWGEAANGFAGIDGRNGSPTGRGVFGFATSAAGTTYGVQGQTSSSTGYGVFSIGNTGASGTKSFRIDHPDDPENKYLLHYSTESPEVINFYRGTITLNEQGEAEVPLPSYFAKINKDPSYQLTAIGAPMPLLHVSRKIDAAALAQGANAAPRDPAPACSFHIAGGVPNAEVCWRVEAVRNDRWTQTHGAPVELAKEGIEKGTYQEPALYNQPQEAGTFNAPK